MEESPDNRVVRNRWAHDDDEEKNNKVMQLLYAASQQMDGGTGASVRSTRRKQPTSSIQRIPDAYDSTVSESTNSHDMIKTTSKDDENFAAYQQAKANQEASTLAKQREDMKLQTNQKYRLLYPEAPVGFGELLSPKRFCKTPAGPSGEIVVKGEEPDDYHGILGVTEMKKPEPMERETMKQEPTQQESKKQEPIMQEPIKWKLQPQRKRQVSRSKKEPRDPELQPKMRKLPVITKETLVSQPMQELIPSLYQNGGLMPVVPILPLPPVSVAKQQVPLDLRQTEPVQRTSQYLAQRNPIRNNRPVPGNLSHKILTLQLPPTQDSKKKNLHPQEHLKNIGPNRFNVQPDTSIRTVLEIINKCAPTSGTIKINVLPLPPGAESEQRRSRQLSFINRQQFSGKNPTPVVQTVQNSRGSTGQRAKLVIPKKKE